LSGFESQRNQHGWVGRTIARMAVVLAVLSLMSQPMRAQAELSSVADKIELGRTPLVVDLMPTPALDAALRAAAQAPVVLAIEGLEGTTSLPVRVNLFLDKPDATSRTSIDDPGFIGFLQLLPVRGTVRRIGHVFDIPASFRLTHGGPVRVTLVPVVGTDSVPGDVSLHIARIFLRQGR
jgi:hypothetical protein